MDTLPIADSDRHGLLDAQLARLGLDRKTPPGQSEWGPLLTLLDEACAVLANSESDDVESVLRRQVTARRSSQTNLFEQSPIAILQLNFSSIARAEPPTFDDVGPIVGLLSQVEIAAANPAATALLGIPPQAADQPVDPGLAGMSDVAWSTLIDMVITGETACEVEFVGSRSDGSSFEALLLAAVPEPFGIPDYSRVVVSMTDITAHKAEERRMHHLVTSKNRLVVSVTGELRSPLAEVIDFARLLGGPVDEPERRRDLAVAIAGGATRVAGIVEDLLVISRSELGDLVIAEVPVDLSAQVAQVLEVGGASLDRVTTPGRNVERRVCLGDPARVRQIIRNLVTDSVDRHDGETSIAIRRRGSTMYLTIASVGPALEPELVARVFGPPRQSLWAPVDPDARFMRLAVARQLAVAMGGDIAYRHGDGVGAFEVTLRSAPAR